MLKRPLREVVACGPSASTTPLAVPERGSLETSAAAVPAAKAWGLNSSRVWKLNALKICLRQHRSIRAWKA